MQVVEQAEEADLYIPVNRGKFQIRTSIKSTHLKMFYESNFFKKYSLLPSQQRTSHSDVYFILGCFLFSLLLYSRW